MTDTRQGGTKLRLEVNNLRQQVDGLKTDNEQLENEIQSRKSDLENLKDENLTLRYREYIQIEEGLGGLDITPLIRCYFCSDLSFSAWWT